MPEVIISGIPVNFPFDPYDLQISYMGKVISCLEKGGNGVLESPTGTGKTLSLLCASCAWLIHKKAHQSYMQTNNENGANGFMENIFGPSSSGSIPNPGVAQNLQSILMRVPKIVYASRTHSQLTQAVQELKRTSYRHVRVAVLGSRDQMCIHPEVSKEENNTLKTILCRAKVKSKTCHFYNNVDKRKEEIIAMSDILDIEDLAKMGHRMQCCPYYTARELHSVADITFLPYNYLLDPRTRKNLGLELMNTVIILDEAHNIEKVCEESVSLSLSNTDIAMCVEEVSQVMKELVERKDVGFNVESSESTPPDFTPEELCILKTLFLELEKAVDSILPGTTYPGDYMFDLLMKADVTPGKRNIVMDILNKVVMYLSTVGSSPFQRKGAALTKFSDLMSLVFRYDQIHPEYVEVLKTCYKVHVAMEEGNKKRTNSWAVSKAPQGKIVNYWCFSPQFGMDHLLGEQIHSLILTSGTLAPLDSFITELGIPITETLENPHIVGENQMCVAIVKNGPDGCVLNSSFNSRDNPTYLASLGRTIVNMSYIIPDGLLVFFPSYSFLKRCQEVWQESGVWSQIERNKPIFVEPRGKSELSEIMTGYYNKIQDPTTKGSCFMAVTRGKVSEGLDFADFNGRAVIIIGIPYPPFKDPRVELKKKYLNEVQQKGKKTINGTQWYSLEATRAVNQAVGRVIRHANDYGAILLCDCRFDSRAITEQLSSWLRPRIKKYSAFGTLVKSVREFFRNAERQLPAPTGKPPIRSFNYSTQTASGPATFDAVTQQKLELGIGETSSSLNVSDESWNPEDYKKPQIKEERLKSESDTNSEGFFEALDKTTPVIDFNDVLPQPDSLSVLKRSPDEGASSSQPAAKKSKLRVVPLPFLPTVSTEIRKADSNAKSQNKIPVSSLSIIDYVKQVKNELGNESCGKLKLACSDYKRNKNIEQLCTALKSIFTSKSSHLLKGYERFVREEHRDYYRRLISSEEL